MSTKTGPTSKELASMIEHTILSGELNEERIKNHIQEALDLHVFGVCLPVAWVPLAKKLSFGTDLKIVTVIDFPLGKKNGPA